MYQNKPEIIFEIANSHNGNYQLLKKTIDQFTKIKTKKKSIKFQIFKYNNLACKNFSWYRVYRKLFFSYKKWEKILNFCVRKKIKIYLDIYDNYGLNFLKNYGFKIRGIKIQYSSINNHEIIHFLKNINQNKNLEIIINITSLTLAEIENIYSELGEIYNNITLQFGHQDYPTKLSNSGFNKIELLKKKFKNSKISFADHLNAESEESKMFIFISNLFKIEQIEKHFCFSRKLSKFDFYSSLELNDLKKIDNLKIDNLKKKFYITKLKNIYKKKFFLNYEKNLRKNFSIAHYSKNLKKNDILSHKEITFKRCNYKKKFDTNNLKKKFFKLKKNVKINYPIKNTDLQKIKVGAIIISRSDSSRLKNKAFLKIGDFTSIEHCIKNTKKIEYLDEVILATTNLNIDRKYRKYTKKLGAKIFYGDPINVVERCYLAAKKNNLDIIIRITGDCPFISKEILEELLINHLTTKSDFTVANKFPVGASGEIINFKALEKLNFYIKKQKDFEYTEYPSFYFRYNPQLFKYNICNINTKYQKNFRITLDYKEDLKMLRLLYYKMKKLKMDNNIENIIKVIGTYKYISKTNSHQKLVYKSVNFIKKIKKIVKIL
tara:strand:- start:1837 stop:3648 length:1812 start_codon:yes stop_codon:yes gene_type:complete